MTTFDVFIVHVEEVFEIKDDNVDDEVEEDKLLGVDVEFDIVEPICCNNLNLQVIITFPP